MHCAGALLVLANPEISKSAAVACLTIALGVTSLGMHHFSPIHVVSSHAMVCQAVDAPAVSMRHVQGKRALWQTWLT